jgi:hypothetical protein
MLCFVLSDSAETGEGRKMLQALFAHESLIRASRVDTFPRPSKVHVLNMVIAIKMVLLFTAKKNKNDVKLTIRKP